MNSDLVHSASERSTQDNRRFAIETKTLKLCMTLFALRTYFAHADLIRDHFDGLLTYD